MDIGQEASSDGQTKTQQYLNENIQELREAHIAIFSSLS